MSTLRYVGVQILQVISFQDRLVLPVKYVAPAPYGSVFTITYNICMYVQLTSDIVDSPKYGYIVINLSTKEMTFGLDTIPSYNIF